MKVIVIVIIIASIIFSMIIMMRIYNNNIDSVINNNNDTHNGNHDDDNHSQNLFCLSLKNNTWTAGSWSATSNQGTNLQPCVSFLLRCRVFYVQFASNHFSEVNWCRGFHGVSRIPTWKPQSGVPISPCSLLDMTRYKRWTVNQVSAWKTRRAHFYRFFKCSSENNLILYCKLILKKLKIFRTFIWSWNELKLLYFDINLIY